MKRIQIIIFSIITSFVGVCQQKVTVEQIFMGAFRPKLMDELQSLKNTNQYTVLNNGGTVVDSKFGYSNYDYDHIISLYNLKAMPDETLLNEYRDYKKFIDEISPHIPINLKL